MSGNSHVFELLPAYALGCLDPEDYALVTRHLEDCATCRIELETYRATAEELALAVVEDEPSPQLQQQLMARISPAPALAAPERPRARWWQALVHRLHPVSSAWAAAGLLLIVALLIGNLWLWQQVRQLEADSRPAAMRTVALSGTDAAPAASALIVISSDGDHGTLVVEGLPPLGPEQQYQLWLIKDGQRDSGAVFSVDEEGYGSEWVMAPEPLARYSAFGVSIEPAGGSPAPTGARVLGGAVD